MGKNKHIGSSFDSFLYDEGLLAEAEAIAIKDSIQLTSEQRTRLWKKNWPSVVVNPDKTIFTGADKLAEEQGR